MIEISNEVLSSLAGAVRTGNTDEILELAQACVVDLEIAGVYVKEATEPLTLQALKLYCKANYGYDSENDTRRFENGYQALKISMALSGDYERGD